ncbi:hypothetical protein A3K24_01510 [candidate division Kazan bacterium RIFCSPHIGHO2_01_FULL_44_14]|uniref:Tetratricopeptide repeat-like domain-containing protein n=1 Tax=candidate division Kazan bacterium RIFCSPLOWO2_01_FULL_45_19 TaxID=1798538 RepID=A0A1F4NPY6_UNCK3|nr:hypothetical protein [uncultured bacterium]OGB73513.1 MAG: hypothetical protein A3K51_01510 [candidate division Kazan bacterium RIFCSPLOWO2_01_FULL_45_19]OGB77758.1 MAG: hypothetical protein A3K24_01510 [candidate division Kazan bacterium RIFCSPHIGHO2_01_FULL_44_14]
MKKPILYIVGGVVAIMLVVATLYTFSNKSLEKYTSSIVGMYYDGKFEEALTALSKAKQAGRYDTNLGIIHGQVLAKLGRYEEARAQYESVRVKDASATQAVNELLAELP